MTGRLCVIAFCAALSARAGTLLTLDGAAHEGELSLDGGIVARGSGTVKVEMRSVLSARFADGAEPEFQPGLVLTDGTRLAGAFSALDADMVTARGLRVPAADVAWAVYAPFDAALVAEVPAGKTGALLAGGDFFEGTVKGGDSVSAKVLNTVFGPRTFRAAEKEALAVVLRPWKSQPAGFEVVTKDGSRLPALDVIARDATGVVLRHPRYDGLRIPAADIVEIRAHPSRYISLAGMKPAKAPENFAARGRALEIPAGAAATWDLQTAGGVLVARVAAGGETSPGTSLIFTVRAGAQTVFRSSPVSPATTPQVVRVMLPAAAALTLLVEGAAGSGTWLDPVVLRR